MAKKKLVHFQENLTFPHLFQPSYPELASGFKFRSKWNELFFRNNHPICVELGCGKGEYTIGLAQQFPQRNYIGIDIKGARLWRGSRTVADQKMKNVGFIRTMVDHLERIFAPGEIDEIWITFPDPQVKKEPKRLTSQGFLDKYDRVLRPNGLIHLKTDDPGFYQYTLEIIKENHHNLLLSTDDLYHSDLSAEVINIQTYYEKQWLEMGKKICYIRFQLRHS